MESWVWWILTCVGSLYFVVLLLEFNKPQQKLVEQIDSQETRHNEMRGRLQQVQQEAEEMSRRMEELDQTWEELEQTRKDLLPLANQRLMVQIPAGPFVMGERCNSNNMVGSTTPVDEFPDGRSPLGLWDMVGNVYEWCSDYYDEEYYKNSPPANPRGPEGGQERVVRGGSFQETRAGLRSTHRAGAAETYNRDNTGFRMAMSSDERPLGRGGGDV